MATALATPNLMLPVRWIGRICGRGIRECRLAEATGFAVTPGETHPSTKKGARLGRRPLHVNFPLHFGCGTLSLLHPALGPARCRFSRSAVFLWGKLPLFFRPLG